MNSIYRIGQIFAKFFSSILITALLITPTLAEHQYKEKDYQAIWCNKMEGILEVVTEDGARADCITLLYAVEFDFAPKWAESVGQSLYYGLAFNKKPGIVLIMENPKEDEKYLKRLQMIAKKYKIKVWTMDNSVFK